MVTSIEQSKPRLLAWLKILLCFIGYFALFGVVKLGESNRVFTPVDARATLLAITVALLFLAVIAIFNPFKK